MFTAPLQSRSLYVHVGTILAIKAALASWIETGGSMVIITSTAGQRGSEIYSAYASAWDRYQ